MVFVRVSLKLRLYILVWGRVGKVFFGYIYFLLRRVSIVGSRCFFVVYLIFREVGDMVIKMLVYYILKKVY